jgi:peptidoglycan-N-acetylglucosamine deacetylase
MRPGPLGWALLGTCLAGTAVLAAGPPVWLIDWIAARHPGCLFRVPTERPALALTIDDSPDPVTTPRILAALERHGARATFFMIAEQVVGLESLVTRVAAAGHELGNHFTRDRPSIRLSSADFSADLKQADSVLTRFAALRWARPGSGWYSREMVTTMAEQGYRCALGSLYPYDALLPSAAFSRWYLLRNARPGAIVVLHDRGDRGRRTALVLDAVLPELKRVGTGS